MIYAVILAAGGSTRMEGKPKALLKDSRSHTYLSRLAATAREGGANGVIVVVGHPHADAIKKALPSGVAAVVNPMPDRGMLSSVQTGVHAVPPACTGVLVWPVDIPFVKASTVQSLIQARVGRIVIPQHGGKGGHPVRIPRQFFGDLMALTGDAGLKALFDARANLVERIDVDDPAILVDVDTPADAAAAEDRAAGHPPSKKKS
jgi:molybdenum cofactor cytidylyltransferase